MSDKTYPIIELAGMLYPHFEFFYVTATTNGQHATNSYHYRGEAVDFGCGLDGNTPALLKAEKGTRFGQMNAFAAFMWLDHDLMVELEHTKPYNPLSGWFAKNGKQVSWRYYGMTDVLAHRNHIHVAVATISAAEKLLTRKVQRALKLTPDGVKGPKTIAAIKAVQKEAGIAQDGIVGAHTVAAIRKHNGWRAV